MRWTLEHATQALRKSTNSRVTKRRREGVARGRRTSIAASRPPGLQSTCSCAAPLLRSLRAPTATRAAPTHPPATRRPLTQAARMPSARSHPMGARITTTARARMRCLWRRGRPPAASYGLHGGKEVFSLSLVNRSGETHRRAGCPCRGCGRSPRAGSRRWSRRA